MCCFRLIKLKMFYNEILSKCLQYEIGLSKALKLLDYLFGFVYFLKNVHVLPRELPISKNPFETNQGSKTQDSAAPILS